jgi:hypothetical protein
MSLLAVIKSGLGILLDNSILVEGAQKKAMEQHSKNLGEIAVICLMVLAKFMVSWSLFMMMSKLLTDVTHSISRQRATIKDCPYKPSCRGNPRSRKISM